MAIVRQTVQKHSDGNGLEPYLVTAGGRIVCLRCTARSTRSKQQCKKPALKVSRTQKCGHHGGRPHTPATLERISAAHTIHGEATKAARQQAHADSVLIHELEDAVHYLRMADGPRTRGRKPNGYRGVRSEADVRRLIDVLHTMQTDKRAG
jgi:hypothetical protein